MLLIGALLARFKKALIGKPGGDKIGRRRLDTHFQGFIDLGAKMKYDAQKELFTIEAEEPMQGTYMLLEEASVTGLSLIHI